jgi:hypothetical protein
MLAYKTLFTISVHIVIVDTGCFEHDIIHSFDAKGELPTKAEQSIQRHSSLNPVPTVGFHAIDGYLSSFHILVWARNNR